MIKNSTNVYLSGKGQTGAIQNVVFNTPASRQPIVFYCTQGANSFAFMISVNGNIDSITTAEKVVIAGSVPDIIVAVAGSAPGEYRIKLENQTNMGTSMYIIFGDIGAKHISASNV